MKHKRDAEITLGEIIVSKYRSESYLPLQKESSRTMIIGMTKKYLLVQIEYGLHIHLLLIKVPKKSAIQKRIEENSALLDLSKRYCDDGLLCFPYIFQYSRDYIESKLSQEQPIFSTRAHVFQIDPNTKKNWVPTSKHAVTVSYFYDSTRNVYRIISLDGSKAIINSTITPNMTFTKTSQKFGQWADSRANTVYGLGFSSEHHLSKNGCSDSRARSERSVDPTTFVGSCFSFLLLCISCLGIFGNEVLFAEKFQEFKEAARLAKEKSQEKMELTSTPSQSLTELLAVRIEREGIDIMVNLTELGGNVRIEEIVKARENGKIIYFGVGCEGNFPETESAGGDLQSPLTPESINGTDDERTPDVTQNSEPRPEPTQNALPFSHSTYFNRKE
eukprot:bmy_16196T0